MIDAAHEWLFQHRPSHRVLDYWMVGVIALVSLEVIAPYATPVPFPALIVMAVVITLIVLPAILFICSEMYPPPSYRARIAVMLKLAENDFNLDTLTLAERDTFNSLYTTIKLADEVRLDREPREDDD